MKKVTRPLALSLATLLLLSALASCGSTPATTTAATTTEPVPATTADPLSYEGLDSLDFDGYEFTVIMTNLNTDANIVRDFTDTEGGTVLDDALYRRNTTAEERLGITITGIDMFGNTTGGVQKIRQSNTAGDSSYDMGIISTYNCGELAQTGDLRDLNDYANVDLTQPWWDQNINSDIKVNNRVYFTTGDISLTATIAMYNMVFNKDMFRENGWEMPYNAVSEGKWTFDMFKEYTLKVSKDLDANDKMDSNDLFGMVYIHSTVIAALGASGERFAKIGADGKIEITLGTERAERAIVDFIELTLDRQHVYNGQTATGGLSAVQMFGEGHCLFRMGEHLMFPYYRDTTLDYGILPLPKLDENQDRYYTPLGGWDASFVCVPDKTENDERTSAIIEYLAYISKQIVTPAYYTKTLVGTYVQDTESNDVITLEMQNRIYDIGYIYNIGNMKDMVENLSKAYNTNFASSWQRTSRAAGKALDKVNNAFFGSN